MMNMFAMIQQNEYLLDKLMKHQEACGTLEQPEGQGIIRCTRCGLKIRREEVAILEGKGFEIEYH